MAQWRKDTVAQRLVDAEALPDGLTVEAFVEHSPDVLHLLAHQGVGRRFDVRFSREYVDDVGIESTVARGLDIKEMYARSEISETAPASEIPHVLFTTHDLPG